MFAVGGLVWFTCAVLIDLLFSGSVYDVSIVLGCDWLWLVVLVLFNSVEHCLLTCGLFCCCLVGLGCWFGVLLFLLVGYGDLIVCMLGGFVGLDCRYCSVFAGCFDFSYFVYCYVGLG